MSDCCSSSSNTAISNKKYKCPVNGNEYHEVDVSTIIKHIKTPWNWIEASQKYYFCEDPNCDVVYYGEDNSIVTKSEVRTKVGIKEQSVESLICYCFGVTRKDVENNPDVKSFVIKQTKDKVCACESLNPSGRCCLKDFPK